MKIILKKHYLKVLCISLLMSCVTSKAINWGSIKNFLWSKITSPISNSYNKRVAQSRLAECNDFINNNRSDFKDLFDNDFDQGLFEKSSEEIKKQIEKTTKIIKEQKKLDSVLDQLQCPEFLLTHGILQLQVNDTKTSREYHSLLLEQIYLSVKNSEYLSLIQDSIDGLLNAINEKVELYLTERNETFYHSLFFITRIVEELLTFNTPNDQRPSKNKAFVQLETLQERLIGIQVWPQADWLNNDINEEILTTTCQKEPENLQYPYNINERLKKGAVAATPVCILGVAGWWAYQRPDILQKYMGYASSMPSVISHGMTVMPSAAYNFIRSIPDGARSTPSMIYQGIISLPGKIYNAAVSLYELARKHPKTTAKLGVVATGITATAMWNKRNENAIEKYHKDEQIINDLSSPD